MDHRILHAVSITDLLNVVNEGKCPALLNGKTAIAVEFSEGNTRLTLFTQRDWNFGLAVQISDGEPVELQGLQIICNRTKEVNLTWGEEAPDLGIVFTGESAGKLKTLSIKVSDTRLWDIVSLKQQQLLPRGFAREFFRPRQKTRERRL